MRASSCRNTCTGEREGGVRETDRQTKRQTDRQRHRDLIDRDREIETEREVGEGGYSEKETDRLDLI